MNNHQSTQSQCVCACSRAHSAHISTRVHTIVIVPLLWKDAGNIEVRDILRSWRSFTSDNFSLLSLSSITPPGEKKVQHSCSKLVVTVVCFFPVPTLAVTVTAS